MVAGARREPGHRGAFHPWKEHRRPCLAAGARTSLAAMRRSSDCPIRSSTATSASPAWRSSSATASCRAAIAAHQRHDAFAVPGAGEQRVARETETGHRRANRRRPHRCVPRGARCAEVHAGRTARLATRGRPTPAQTGQAERRTRPTPAPPPRPRRSQGTWKPTPASTRRAEARGADGTADAATKDTTHQKKKAHEESSADCRTLYTS